MSKGARAAFVVVGFAVALALVVYGVVGWLLHKPPTISAQPSSTPGVVNVTIQIDGAVGTGPHPSWVGYRVQNASGQWIRTTVIQLPAHSDVHFTVYQYDSGSGFRNPVWDQVAGTVGGVAYLNGKSATYFNDQVGNGIGHSFNVPALGINVPFAGVNGNASNFCNAGPCTMSQLHNTITFDIKTGNPGTFRWQCFVPCGLGYLNGNGGPMTTVGYMGGFLKVVA